jgi:excisionase family DNA binding protein
VKQLFSSKEIGAAVGVSSGTVIGWARRGLIEAIRFGEKGRWRFPASAVAQAIKARQAEVKRQPQPASHE